MSSGTFKVSDESDVASEVLSIGVSGDAAHMINLPPNIEVQTSGGYTYFAYSIPPAALSDPNWVAFRITDATGSTMYADGNRIWDNVATTLSALTYSFS